MTSSIAVFLTAVLLTNSIGASIVIPPEVQETMNKPPSITRQYIRDVYYAVQGVPIRLPCVADGYPGVISPDGYTWKKDGRPLDVVSENDGLASDGSIVMSSGVGTIIFKGSDTLNEEELRQYIGEYQCFATNVLGTAMTKSVTVRVATAPNQKPENVEVQVREGGSASFSCNYSNPDGRVTTWHFDRDNVTLTNRIVKRPDAGLVFSNILAEDDGLEFWCIVKGKATRKYTDGPHYTLIVDRDNPVLSSPPEIVSPVEERRVVLRGDVLKLTCVATGNPTPTIKWKVLSGGWPAGRYSDSGQTATIVNVKESDEGTYKCTASNGEGETSKVVSIQVDSRPYFRLEDHCPRDVVRAPGGNVTIRCQPKGKPKPSVEWRVNGQPITLPQDNREVSANRITLRNLKIEDTAVYQCISSNKYGSIIEQAFVNVLTSKPIALSSNIPVHKQIEGKQVEMKCHFFGSPPPTITWMKNGMNVSGTDRFTIRKHKNLQIQKLQETDAGDYTCLATNTHGKATVNFSLNVLKPSMLVTVGSPPYKVAKGSSITLRVLVKVDPELSDHDGVMWSKDRNSLVARGSAYEVTDANPSDAGIYKASLFTTMDQAEQYMELIVTNKPLPPSNFTFEIPNETPLIAVFTWVPGFDNYDHITKYKIEFEENNYEPGSWQTLKDDVDGSSTSAEVELSPGVSYRFRVLAKNSVGWSERASESTGRYSTPPGRPLNPSGVKGTGTAPGNLLITWNPVRGLDQNAPGFGYELSYRPVDQSSNWTVLPLAGGIRSYRMIGSTPYLPYLIKVRSYNSVGRAMEPKTITAYSGEDEPLVSPSSLNVKTSKGSPTTATLTWIPVDVRLVRGEMKGYNITYSIADSQGSDMSTSVLGNTNSSVVKSLRPDTHYIFQVAVFNNFFVGPYSTSVSIKTPIGKPGQASLQVRSVDTAANVTWSASPDGLPATEIYVEYATSKDKKMKKWETAGAFNADDMFASVDGLKPGTTYYFRVTATNQYGSTVSKEVMVKTAGAELSAGSVTSEIWFIVLMCIVGLIILAILIACFVRKSKGGKYSVAEREQQLGDAETQPINKEDSGEYNDETDDVKKPLKGSNIPSNGDAKTPSGGVAIDAPLRTRGDSVGGDSIEAFADAEAREFNEDGSFIGQYGVIQGDSANTTPATSPGGENVVAGNPEGDAV